MKAKRSGSASKKTVKQKRQSPNIGKVQLIEWADHTATGNHWQPIEDVKVILNNFSVGLVQFEDDKTVTLIRDWCHHNGQVSAGLNIIKSCIVKRTNLNDNSRSHK